MNDQCVLRLESHVDHPHLGCPQAEGEATLGYLAYRERLHRKDGWMPGVHADDAETNLDLLVFRAIAVPAVTAPLDSDP